ncbi:hypothetical protein CLBEIC_35650 [Clostridium beijerinckii]|nr:hypothetical protein CLOBI_25040 [Clostridium beijerinckii]OOM68096.1 hypothetical protein CLBEIC_35650 [Clostridium beijerinckii]
MMNGMLFMIIGIFMKVIIFGITYMMMSVGLLYGLRISIYSYGQTIASD